MRWTSSGFSYGFRPGRSPHDALDALAVGIDRKKVNWVLDADIRDFFTSLDHGWLQKFLEHRIADKRVLRLIRKWINAGVIEDGAWSATEVGAPQGASASPLLANVYLHYVFDRWARQWRRRHAHGDVVIVRFADDFIAGFEHEKDARQFLADLRERFAKFGLELHPDKTRLIEFGRYAARDRKRAGRREAGDVRLLGLHAHVRQDQDRAVLDETQDHLETDAGQAGRRQRPAQSSAGITPIPEQGRWVGSVVRGHFAYYAVPGNSDALEAFRAGVIHHWFNTLRRRSQRTRLTWDRMRRLVLRWLPSTRILHPLPYARFDARTHGRSPVR